MKGYVERGKTTIQRCVMCNKVGDVGIDYGPSLNGWSQKQGFNTRIIPGNGPTRFK